MPIISLPVSDLSDAGGRGGGRREEGGEGGGGSIYSYFFSVDRAVEAFNPDLILNKNK